MNYGYILRGFYRLEAGNRLLRDEKWRVACGACDRGAPRGPLGGGWAAAPVAVRAVSEW